MPGYVTAPMTLGRVLKHEAPNFYSRSDVTVLAGSGAERTLEMGTVIGKITKDLSSLAAVAGGNTGNGTAGAVTTGAKAQVGDYVLTCIESAEDGGTFQVVAPDGQLLPNLSAGVAYAGGHVNLTIAVGDTDFALGDVFTIAVPEGSGKVVALNLSAVDGSELPAGVMGTKVIAAIGSDAPGWAILRHAVVSAANLVWPDGITNAQKTAALARLAELGIIAREEV